jgi:hypothetical protein
VRPAFSSERVCIVSLSGLDTIVPNAERSIRKKDRGRSVENQQLNMDRTAFCAITWSEEESALCRPEGRLRIERSPSNQKPALALAANANLVRAHTFTLIGRLNHSTRVVSIDEPGSRTTGTTDDAFGRKEFGVNFPSLTQGAFPGKPDHLLVPRGNSYISEAARKSG